METIIKRTLLSDREKEIMLLVSSGKYNKEIAYELQCEVGTIKKHMQHIFMKLGVQNRIEASNKFMKITGKVVFTE